MKIAKDGIRSHIRVGYDERVYKTFCGSDKNQRYETEVQVLRELEARNCDFVPRILEEDPKNLSLITTSCGAPVQNLAADRIDAIFEKLQDEYGVIHSDPYPASITFDHHRGRFCVINFEESKILGEPVKFAPAKKLTWFGASKSGMRKPDNEDSLAVFGQKAGYSTAKEMGGQHSMKSGPLNFVVSDGMGGHAGGAVASSQVISQLQVLVPAALGDQVGAGSPASLLEKSILNLHSHVLRLGESKPALDDMGATVVCGYFSGSELHYGHIGDSRLYRFRDGRLVQLTEDHSFVGRLIQEGKINEREARINPRKNILTQAIGAQCYHITPDVDSSLAKAGDWFLFCSDGLIDGLWDKQIEQEFLMAALTHNTPKGVATNLLERSYHEAGRDDTTLFVIQVE